MQYQRWFKQQFDSSWQISKWSQLGAAFDRKLHSLQLGTSTPTVARTKCSEIDVVEYHNIVSSFGYGSLTGWMYLNFTFCFTLTVCEEDDYGSDFLS